MMNMTATLAETESAPELFLIGNVSDLRPCLV